MPAPLSVTRISTVAASAQTLSSIRPPTGVNFAALCRMFATTCVSRAESPNTSRCSSMGEMRQRVPPLRNQRLARFDRVEDDVAHLDARAFQLDDAPRDARDVHQVVHEPAQVRDLALDHA